jgi:HSP20 family protein
MATKKESGLVPKGFVRDPFTLLRQMTSELDRMFEETAWPAFRRPLFRARGPEAPAWFPEIDVFERGNRLVTKVDLPGLKKDDVKVEVTDGQLLISGERKTETEVKKEEFYKCEREYGSFFRTVPLPEGVKITDVVATFTDGVLEVSVPLPAQKETKVQKVEIQEAPKAAKTAA